MIGGGSLLEGRPGSTPHPLREDAGDAGDWKAPQNDRGSLAGLCRALPCTSGFIEQKKLRYSALSFLCAGIVAPNWSQACFLHICFLGGAADNVGLPQMEREGENGMGGTRNWGDVEAGTDLGGRLAPIA